MKKILGLSIIIVLLSSPLSFSADNSKAVGSVKTVTGSASILREAKSLPVAVGQRLFEDDTLQTGKDGSMGVIFRDDTLLSMGPNTVIRVDEYIFSPREDKLALVIKMMKGIAAYLSGKIAKLSPESVRFETPKATIGIRGTQFLVKVEQDSP